MKSLALVGALLLLGGGAYGRNAWELSRIDPVDRAADLAMREAKRAATSLIVYDKSQMKDIDIDDEITRIVAKCTELECPCSVEKLDKVGVFEVTWSCDNHPSVNELGLDSTKETGVEDQLVDINSSPPPKDPRFSEQWALQDLANNADINIAEGWAEYLSDAKGGSADGPSVVVAVIDTGVDYTHPDLKDVMWNNPGEIPDNGKDDDGNGIVDDFYGADFTQTTKGTGDPIDRNSHGTHCSGIIAATPNNGQGVAGVASFTKGKVKIMAVKGLSDAGGGTISGLLAGLNYAIAKGAKISSNSWGGGTVNGIEQIWDDVLRNNLDHLFIAAAGNENQFISDSFKSMTCGLKEPNLLCVASSTKSDEKSGFSNYGKDYVHVFAPGSDILSTFPNNKYASISGTSMATPMVSGLAALIRTMRDGLSGQEVRKLIEDNVQVKSKYAEFVSTSGLIDVGKTIKALKNGNVTPAPPTNKKCRKIQIKTTDWGNENSYSIGECVSKRVYADGKQYKESCCLTPGKYNLVCKDSFQDGWHGGYLKIKGKKYCDDFLSGNQKTVQVDWS